MITKYGPDGKPYQFPDGTTEDVMRAAMARVYGGPQKNQSEVTAQKQKTSILDDTLDLVRMGAQGYTYGLGDDVAAGIQTVGGFGPGKTFKENLDAQSRRTAETRERMPWLSAGAELAGVLASPATRMISRRFPVTSAMGLAEKSAQFGKQGLLGGGLYGVGEANTDDITERLKSGGLGAALGGAFGASLPAGMQVAGNIVRGLSDMLSTAPTVASRKLLRALEASGMSVDDAQRMLAEYGPEAVIADLSKNLQGLGRYIAQMPGKAMEMAEEVLTPRQAQQAEAVVTKLKNIMGVSSNYADDMAELTKKRAREASPYYKQAFEQFDDITSKELDYWQSLADDPQSVMGRDVREGLARGYKEMKAEAEMARMPFDRTKWGVTDFNEAGDPIVDKVRMTSIRQWDAVKRGLDAKIDDARDPITNKIKWTPNLRRVDQMRREIVAELKNITGGDSGPYAMGLAKWAGPSKVRDAMERGYDATKLSPDELANALRGMSDDELNGYRQGFVEKFIDIAGNKADGTETVRKAFETPFMRQRISLLTGSSEAADDFTRFINTQKIFSETNQTVQRNSLTQMTQAGQADMAPGVVEGAMNAAAQPGTAFARLLDIAGGGQMARPPTLVADELAPKMFSQDPRVQQQVFDELRRRVSGGTILGRMMGPGTQTGLLTTGARVGAYSGGRLAAPSGSP